MYPSDYGYATSGGSTNNRKSCLNKELYNWNDTAYSDCKNNDWIYKYGKYQWALALRSSNSYDVFIVHSAGNIDHSSSAYYKRMVLPSVYLKSSVEIVNGNGSKESPYELLGD